MGDFLVRDRAGRPPADAIMSTRHARRRRSGRTQAAPPQGQGQGSRAAAARRHDQEVADTILSLRDRIGLSGLLLRMPLWDASEGERIGPVLDILEEASGSARPTATIPGRGRAGRQIARSRVKKGRRGALLPGGRASSQARLELPQLQVERVVDAFADGLSASTVTRWRRRAGADVPVLPQHLAAVAMIVPQLITLGSPSPRNDRPASSRIAWPSAARRR